MMPVVRIPEPIYKRLQAIAVPLEDTIVTVIDRLLSEYEAGQPSQQITESENYRVLDPDDPANLRYTRLIRAVINDSEIRQPNWSKIIDAAHILGFHKGLSPEDLIKLTLSNVVKGEKNNTGFHYLPEVNISVQGVDANYAWRNTLHLAKNLKVPVEVYFEWLPDEEKAAYPGEKGKLVWTPR
jgi:hypothetical protein